MRRTIGLRVTAIAVTLLLAACQSVAPASTSTTEVPPASSSTTTTTQGQQLVVYHLFQGYPTEVGPFIVPVARPGAGDVESALEELLRGVTFTDGGQGLSTSIPAGTRLRGVTVREGVAAVDLTAEFASGGGSLSVLSRVAQVVYTATRFEGVDAVEFLIDGLSIDVLGGEGLILDEPQTRDGYRDLLPAIFVDDPAWGGAVGSPLVLRGVAAVRDGDFEWVLVDGEGLIITEGIVGVDGDGTFHQSVAVPAGALPTSLIVFDLAADGSQQHVLEYPLSG